MNNYATKMDNLEGMDNFLEKYNLTNGNRKKENKNRPITSTEIKTNKNIFQTKTQSQMVSQANSTKSLEKS